MVISETPLRISFAGGGTDLRSFYEKEDGMVISTAIDKYIYVIVKERFDDRICISYSKREVVSQISEIKHELVREAMKKVGLEKGIEIITLADIPSAGSGLGSSSSVTVGLLNALYHFSGQQVPLERLAREACEIEIDLCKKPIGKQDQYTAAYGGLNKITFHPDESVLVSKIPISNRDLLRLSSHLILFYTNRTRKADAILKKLKTNIRDKREDLRLMKNFVLDLEDSLIKGKFNEIGKLLHKNWLIKKSLVHEISTPDVDDMYQKAMSSGALGGKLCGAGGGGFLLLYIPTHKQDAVRSSLKDYRELPFIFDPYGSRIIFSFRRYPSK